MAKANKCAYCYGFGIEAGHGVWWRRPVEVGTHGRINEGWKNCKRVPCDRCGTMKP